VYSAAIPQRADMVLERCTNAVATPFGVTGALVQLTKSLVKQFFFANAVAVMLRRNISMAEKRLVFKAKK